MMRPSIQATLFSLPLAAMLAMPGARLLAADPQDSARSAIRSALQTWTADFNAGRAGAVCDLFSRDLIASYQGQPERGYQGQCEVLTRSLRDPARHYSYAFDLKEILPCGDLAVVRLAWTLEVTSAAGEKRVVEELSQDVFRREQDGAWRIIRYLAYPAMP